MGKQKTDQKKSASKVKKKYLYSRGYPRSPSKPERARKALSEVNAGQSVIKTAEKYNLTYSYLQRRVSGTVDIQSRNGPPPYLSQEEEDSIANYIAEMALRGMGLSPCDIINLVQKFLLKEKRKNPFKESRPSYSWYYGFMARHVSKLERRKEKLLDGSRSKVTTQAVDNWFEKFRKFLSDRDLLDKPQRIWNADETGFSMGSKPGTVIGPCRSEYPEDIPHVSGGSTKSRLSVMYCGNAEGNMMPPLFVYPEPKPTAYDPLMGAARGARVEYTQKGWMDTATFSKFMEHFDTHADKTERPVVLLIDSVSSHINMDIFTSAVSKGIEMYRLIPNATHLMQPLDKGVFGPLKKEWYKTVRKNTKNNPDKPINKKTFASKLHETYMAFYKPSIVIGAFKGSGIYPISRQAVSNQTLKPSATFVVEVGNASESEVASCEQEFRKESESGMRNESAAKEAFQVYNSVIKSPARRRYETKWDEGCDVENLSPGFDVYKSLREMATPSTRKTPASAHNLDGSVCNSSTLTDTQTYGLDLLVTAAQLDTPSTSNQTLTLSHPVESYKNPLHDHQSTSSTPIVHGADRGSNISPELAEVLQLPTVNCNSKEVRQKRLLDSLPFNLTSKDSIRTMALKKLKFAQDKAKKEKIAKAKFQEKKAKEMKKSIQKQKRGCKGVSSSTEETVCPGCSGIFEEEVGRYR